MTNAEKYEQIFGFPADISNCPTSDCWKCPCAHFDNAHCVRCTGSDVDEWWKAEFKEGNNNDVHK